MKFAFVGRLQVAENDCGYLPTSLGIEYADGKDDHLIDAFLEGFSNGDYEKVYDGADLGRWKVVFEKLEDD